MVSFTIEDDCYVNNKFIGTTVAKKITVNILNPDNEINLENKEISAFAGIEIDGVKEEIPFGNFIVKKTENKEVQSKTSFVGYDYMIKFNTAYKDTNTYPISLQKFFSNLCNQVGLEAGTEKMVNADYQILGNPFTNNETCKTVLSAIAQLCGGFAKIGRDNKVHIITLANETKGLTVETVNLMTVEEVNEMLVGDATVAEALEKIDGNNYDTTFKKNNVWGEVNSLIIRLSDDVEGENTVRENPDSIATNGLTEVTISGNEFLIDETEREKVIPELWENLSGIKYLPFSTDYYGYPYLDSGDKIKVLDNKDIEYDSYVLNHKFTYNSSFSGKITTEALTKTETKYKNIPDIKTKFRNVELKVDKINGQITSVIEEVNENTDKVSKMEQTVDEINTKVQNVAGLSNEKTGLNSILLENCMAGNLFELHIYGNNTVFGDLYPSKTLYPSETLYPSQIISALEVTDQDGNSTIYDLDIKTVLRQSGEYYDEFVIKDEKAYVIRRITLNDDGSVTIDENGTIENEREFVIPLAEGNNTIKILNYSANMYAKWIIENDYTDVFATKIEMNTKISQTAEEIKAEVSKEITTATGELEEEISSISQTANQIQTKVTQNTNDITKMNSTITQQADKIEAKLDSDDFTSSAVIGLINNRDGTSTAKINASNINLTGYVTATNLSTSGSTTINGDNIKTGTISADRIDTSNLEIGSANVGTEISAQPIGWLAGHVASPNGESTNPIAYFGAFDKSSMHIPRQSVGAEIWDNGEIYLRRVYTESGADSSSYMGFIKTVLSGNTVASINFILGHTSAGSRGVNVNTYAESYDIYAATSDERLKENIVDAEIDALSIINLIKLISFYWKETGEYQALGFSAQQLKTVCEDFVSAVKQPEGAEYDEILQVRDFNILPYIVKGLQEASTELKETKEEVKTLKEENANFKLIIEDLTKRIESLEKGIQ